ncbi:hypothetical protein B0H11DRAFT_2217561 [Mycena galericulata]|nr:hypothetical protein B0H11DRAFT_2217561 [Mycena galericulata]
MSTVSQIHTFLKHYFGEALSRLFAMLCRDVKADIESVDTANTELVPDGVPASTDCESVFAEVVEPSASELFSAVVAVNLVLPSLPLILKIPEARAPMEAQDRARQDFGRPSNIYHDRRMPFGCITNIPGETVKVITSKPPKTKKKRTPKVINWSLPTGASRGPRSRTKSSRPVAVAAEVPPPVSSPCAATASDSVVAAPSPPPGSAEWNDTKVALLAQVRDWNEQVKASQHQSLPIIASAASPEPTPAASKRHSAPPVLMAAAVLKPVVAAPSPAPGSCEWNTTKTTLLAQARNWNEQVKTSQRKSLPIVTSSASPEPTRAASKRHSAPPVLVGSSKSPRLGLQTRLAALIRNAEATITTLDAVESSSRSCVLRSAANRKTMSTDNNRSLDALGSKDPRTFSAVALESAQDIFVVGDDSDDEEAAPEPISTARRSRDLDAHKGEAGPPTVNVARAVSAAPSSALIASISASRSMAALASACSRSLDDILNAFDGVLAAPSWRRLLSRSDGITRRNDSVV